MDLTLLGDIKKTNLRITGTGEESEESTNAIKICSKNNGENFPNIGKNTNTDK